MPTTDRSDAELYWLIRRAIRDAIWDVIQTLLTVFITIILLVVGVGFTTQGFRMATGGGGLLAAAFGLVLMAAGIVYFLREFDLLPFT